MRAIGIILAGGNSKRLKELSQSRAVCAMPVAGSYRSIDFALSNMEQSRIQKVAVLTQYSRAVCSCSHLLLQMRTVTGTEARQTRSHRISVF